MEQQLKSFTAHYWNQVFASVRNVASLFWGINAVRPALRPSFVMTFFFSLDKFVLPLSHRNAHIASEVCIYHLGSHLKGVSHLEKQTAC